MDLEAERLHHIDYSSRFTPYYRKYGLNIDDSAPISPFYTRPYLRSKSSESLISTAPYHNITVKEIYDNFDDQSFTDNDSDWDSTSTEENDIDEQEKTVEITIETVQKQEEEPIIPRMVNYWNVQFDTYEADDVYFNKTLPYNLRNIDHLHFYELFNKILNDSNHPHHLALRSTLRNVKNGVDFSSSPLPWKKNLQLLVNLMYY